MLQTRLALEVLPTTIERVLGHFQQRQLPFHWRLGPSSQPANFGDLLQARGIAHNEDEPGMAVDLLTLNEDIQLSSSIATHPVTTEELLAQWMRAWGCGAPEEVIQQRLGVYSNLHLGPQHPLHLYLGTLDGEPVATVALFFGAGVAAIHDVVTVHRARRQGIGAAMTLMAAREARTQGYRIGILPLHLWASISIATSVFARIVHLARISGNQKTSREITMHRKMLYYKAIQSQQPRTEGA